MEYKYLAILGVYFSQCVSALKLSIFCFCVFESMNASERCRFCQLSTPLDSNYNTILIPLFISHNFFLLAHVVRFIPSTSFQVFSCENENNKKRPLTKKCGWDREGNQVKTEISWHVYNPFFSSCISIFTRVWLMSVCALYVWCSLRLPVLTLFVLFFSPSVDICIFCEQCNIQLKLC